ncbi:MAG: hypothetical protein Q4D02_07405 [Clostridia bacterium]|nr:hypothetical protein [Clostridia bacterium]
MKGVKMMNFFALKSEVQNILKEYYNKGTCGEQWYVGKDESLLDVFRQSISIGIAVYHLEITSVLKFLSDKRGNIEVIYTNIFYKKPLEYKFRLDEITCENRKIKILNPRVPKVLEGELTNLMYLLNFKQKYPYVVERFRLEDGSYPVGYKNAFTISEDKACEIVYFPFKKEIQAIDMETLPEFFVTSEALEIIDKKVGADYMAEDPIYPFSEFVVTLDDFRILCKLNNDQKRIRILLRFESGRPVLLANCEASISGEFTLCLLDQDSEDMMDDPKDFTKTLISILNLLLYYYSHYKVEYVVEEKERKSNENRRKYHPKQSQVSTIMIPRKVIRINKEKVKTTRKRRKPLYTTKSWGRASHIRKYRDSTGKVIKEVIVKEAVCHRKCEDIPDGTVQKKVFKISPDALDKATKQ